MKNLLRFLLILFLFSCSEMQAQQSDSLQLMKKKSKRFIATIETTDGLKKGLLYEVDSSQIVILDSLYHRIEIPISSINSLVIRRSNNIWHGMKVGFWMAEIPALIIGTGFLISVFITVNPGILLTIALVVPLFAIPFALVSGAILATFSGLIPTVNIDTFTKEEYLKRFRVINQKSQRNLLVEFPRLAKVYVRI
jgi:hypothetical protein